MPYKSIYINAEKFLTHRDVDIFHVYEDNDIDAIAKVHHYCLQSDSDVYSDADFPHFDVTSLPNWVPDPHPLFINHNKDDLVLQQQKQEAWNDYWQQGGELAHIRKILCDAIDLGFLSQTAVVCKDEFQSTG